MTVRYSLAILFFLLLGCRTTVGSGLKDSSVATTSYVGLPIKLSDMPFAWGIFVEKSEIEPIQIIALDFANNPNLANTLVELTGRQARVFGQMNRIKVENAYELRVIRNISKIEKLEVKARTQEECEGWWKTTAYKKLMDQAMSLAGMSSPVPRFQLSSIDHIGLLIQGIDEHLGCTTLMHKGKILDKWAWPNPRIGPRESSWFGPVKDDIHLNEFVIKNGLSSAEVVTLAKNPTNTDHYHIFHEIFHSFQHAEASKGRWTLGTDQAKLEEANQVCYGLQFRNELWMELKSLLLAINSLLSGDKELTKLNAREFVKLRANRLEKMKQLFVATNSIPARKKSCRDVEAYQEKLEGSAEFASQWIVNEIENLSPKASVSELLKNMQGDRPAEQWTTESIWYRFGSLQLSLIYLLDPQGFPAWYDRFAVSSEDDNFLTLSITTLLARP